VKGWKTRNFQIDAFVTIGGWARPSGAVGAMFSYGEKDYYLGGSFTWQLFRVAYRMTKRPLLVGGLALFSGFCWAALRRVPRPVSGDLMRFHRREQMTKLKGILRLTDQVSENREILSTGRPSRPSSLTVKRPIRYHPASTDEKA
jgi:hypothetical protein